MKRVKMVQHWDIGWHMEYAICTLRLLLLWLSVHAGIGAWPGLSWVCHASLGMLVHGWMRGGSLSFLVYPHGALRDLLRMQPFQGKARMWVQVCESSDSAQCLVFRLRPTSLIAKGV